MNRARHVATLREVSALRALQSSTAQTEAARAMATARDRDGAARARAEDVAALEEAWRAAVGSDFSLDLVAGWANAVRSGEVVLRDAREESRQAEAQLRATRNAWRTAHRRQENADDAVRLAERGLRAAHDEAALHAATERLLARWRPA